MVTNIPTLTGTDSEAKRQEIRAYFLDSYAQFERLFAMLKDDGVFYRKSEPTRHPMIFYFGHTATFFINKLLLAQVISRRINPDYESMFAIGVDEMAWDDMEGSRYDWPPVADVRAYRAEVKRRVLELIDTLPLTLPVTPESPWWVILMGIEHERIHIETSSVLHRQMPLESIWPVAGLEPWTETPEAPANTLIPIEAATVTLGKRADHPLYGWDNEYGSLTVETEPFAVSRYLVSNAEYLPFVQEGGYERSEFWDDEGEAFLEERGALHPPFWVPDGQGGYRLRVLDREIPLPEAWPVEVNDLEAMAFCRWKSDKEEAHYGLMSEAQWTHLRERAAIPDVPEFDPETANIAFAHGASPCPVDRFAFGDLYDVVGNVWQWTRTPIDGYPGFAPHPIYDDFSTPTFDGRHNLIKGGSFASTGNEIMAHSRYAFRRHFYQHAGFRYIRTEQPIDDVVTSGNIYEEDAAVNQYSDFHYGESYFGVENFAQKLARLAIHYTAEGVQGQALDIGCATGRCAFELTQAFDTVTGVDFSARFVQVAAQLQREGLIRFKRTIEGAITEEVEVAIDAFAFAPTRDRVTFWQGDACNLKPHFTGYDLIIANNLIDRLYEPRLFLEGIEERLNPGGTLIIASPYTWQEESTRPEHWLGGDYDAAGNPRFTFDTLGAILGPHFELIDRRDVPFVIRETARKFQHTLSEVTVWRKR